MSIVARPFVLDFAGAWLDTPPDFPGETWAEWESREARRVRGTMAKSAGRPGSIGDAGHSHGGCVSEQHRIPGLKWPLGRGANTVGFNSWMECRRGGAARFGALRDAE